MKIPVVGMDPSLRNWGIAEAMLDLQTGLLDTPKLSLVQPRDSDNKKQVRKNSLDLQIAKELSQGVTGLAERAKVVFVEVPVGSQSARAMASYGICLGILGSLKGMGIEIIEVSPDENKMVFTGSKTATKRDMIDTAYNLYPTANWPIRGDRVTVSKAEHMADAIAAIHAGVQTTVFQNIMRLLRTTTT